jgi:Ca2+-binding RTX toxin-like protein
MRKILVVLVAAALLAAMAAPAALAISKACTANTCSGTNGADKLRERAGKGATDNRSGKGGKDLLRADLYGSDRDVLKGGSGNDTLNARDRDSRDTLDGGPGTDSCKGDYQDSFRGCETQIETG